MGAPSTDKVRNVVLVGHGGAGKTSLAEAMQVAVKRDFDAVVLDANLGGKPVDERLQITLTLIGITCLLTLMVLVCYLDFDRYLLR